MLTPKKGTSRFRWVFYAPNNCNKNGSDRSREDSYLSGDMAYEVGQSVIMLTIATFSRRLVIFLLYFVIITCNLEQI